jgi:hypothetical protein
MRTGCRPSERIAGSGSVLLFALFVSQPSTAHAYIDPGYGTLLVQLVLSGFLGVLFFARKALRKVLNAVSSQLSSRRNRPPDTAPSSDNGVAPRAD